MTKSTFLAAALIALVTATAFAQTAPADNPLWNGVYTNEQAARGLATFGTTCASCHTLDASGNRPLSGKKFWDSYTLKSVGDLLTFIQKNMPNGRGGTLSEATSADLAALVLQSNGVPPGTAELAPAAAAAIPIVPKEGAAELPAGALVRIVGCLAKNGSDYVVTNVTAAERTGTESKVTDEDATRSLGSKSFALKYMFTKPDADVGKRVMARGLLIGVGGVDGLSVSSLTKVSDTCP